ncbi:helix-turn-helix transcriptional regulator [Christensenellaceae bacterium OttesenSCG-928-K19]|nr:helix-turn-helix transcriptional regulator [Christensenellaceae bacterium OttesenSCG-928-K19]
MAIYYIKLFELLKQKNMKKSELQRLTAMSSSAMSKLVHNWNVTVDVIDRICEALKCQPGDIIEYADEQNTGILLCRGVLL